MPTDTQQQTINTANNNIINANQLDNPTPELNIPTNTVDYSQYLNTAFQTTPQEQQNIDTLQSNSNDIFASLYGSLQDKSTQGARTVRAEQDAGIPQLRTDLTDITNQITQTSLDFRREREKIQTTPGLTVGQVNARLADVSRKQASQLADLEVIRQARSNTLTNVESTVQRKLDLEFADENARIDNLKFLYGEIKGDLTKAEDRQFQKDLKREEAKLDFKKSEYTQLQTEKINLIRNAQANGAGNSVLSAIMQAGSIEDAYRSAGRFGISLADQIQQADLRKKLADLGVEQDVVTAAEDTVNQINIINDALNNKAGLNAASGGGGLGRIGLFRAGKKADFGATVEQLVSGLTLDNLISAKKNGATFGALSEGELKILAASASRLGGYMRKRKNGDVYFKANQKDVEKELQKIKDFAIKDFEKRTGVPYEEPKTETDYVNSILNGYSPFSSLAN